MKATKKSETVIVRNPEATRPWQHVLEPLSGYLLLGGKLLEGIKEFAEAWNFGPELGNNVPVSEIVNNSKKYWNDIAFTEIKKNNSVHEANLLMLDCSKANKLLKWKSVWNFSKTLKKTIEWYKTFYQTKSIDTMDDLFSYINDAQKKCVVWTH